MPLACNRPSVLLCALMCMPVADMPRAPSHHPECKARYPGSPQMTYRTRLAEGAIQPIGQIQRGDRSERRPSPARGPSDWLLPAARSGAITRASHPRRRREIEARILGPILRSPPHARRLASCSAIIHSPSCSHGWRMVRFERARESVQVPAPCITSPASACGTAAPSPVPHASLSRSVNLLTQ